MSECKHARTVSLIMEGMPLALLSKHDVTWVPPVVAVHRCITCGRVRQIDESWPNGMVSVTRLEART
jgi:hypothetical protein